MAWIRLKIWADPVYVRSLYLYVRPISRTFLRLSVCSFVCVSVTAACSGTFFSMFYCAAADEYIISFD